ncbi:MAG TPA: ATP-binding protein [Saprospiraceae bacterium]|nr:ATP-binding protein [Saprospiraceae bacterium]
MIEVKPFVITIVGAESSGKTTLALQLAEYFKSVYVPEYARDYLALLERPYNEEDLLQIANQQIGIINAFISGEESAVNNIVNSEPSVVINIVEPEPSAVRRNKQLESSQGGVELLDSINSKIENLNSKLVIVDGGMMTLRMWARIKYKIEIPVVEEALNNDSTDLYILCRPRKEWKFDPLREAPDLIMRAWIYNLYLEELIQTSKDFEIVKV